MAQEQVLKRRVRSVKNAKQITKALEVVAAARMRRVQTAVESARSYGNIAASIIRRISPSQEAQQHPYFKNTNKAASYTLYLVATAAKPEPLTPMSFTPPSKPCTKISKLDTHHQL